MINNANPSVASHTAGVKRRIKMKGERDEVVIRAHKAVASIRVSRRRITDNR